MNCRVLIKALALAVLISSAPVSAQSKDGWHFTPPADVEQVRQQLLELVNIHNSMLSTYEALGGDAPHLQLAINRELALVQQLTTEQLQILVDARIPLSAINSELRLNMSRMIFDTKSIAGEKPVPQALFVPSSAADPAPQTAGATQLGNNCPQGQIITTGESLRLPPGPCNQTDDVPVGPFNTNDGSRTLAEFRLSDVQYPFVCPIDTPAPFIVGYEVVFNIANYLVTLAKPPCDQRVVGFNASVACVPFVLSVSLAEEILGYFKYCNGVRRNSDGTAIYVRTGEIFVQSNAHYAALDSRTSDTDTQIIELETDVSAEVNAYGSEVSTELQAGFGEIDVRMDILEQRILDNQERTDFTRLNNAEIVKEIRIQKARILGDLLNN